jgi:hypothetical protein
VAPQFGVPNAAETTFSFVDGSADVVVVRGLAEDGQVLFERWLRPSLLTLVGGRRYAQLFDIAEFEAAYGDQAETKAGEFLGPVEDLSVEFLRVTWDKERAVSAQGRVLPLLAGYSVRVSESAYDPCPYQPDAQAECTKGRRHVLLVATANGIEMFDANTGEHLDNVLELEGANFKQVVQEPGGCLIATQNRDEESGVYAYKLNTEGIDVQPLGALVTSEDIDFAPTGLAALSGGPVLIANATGPTIVYLPGQGSGPFSEPMSGYGISVIESQGVIAVADRSTPQTSPANTHGITALNAEGEGEFFPLGVSILPEQIAFSASSVGGMLGMATAGSRSLTLFSSGDVPTLLASYAFPQGTGTPRGVFPLNAEGKWLVAGTDGLGVQIVDFTGSQPTATPTGNLGSAQAQYISSACVPF